jgi:hypothetical protein
MKQQKYIIILVLTIFMFTSLLYSQEKAPDFPVLKGEYLGQKPPGKTPELFAPGMVSTKEYTEYCMTFMPNGSEIYFSRALFGLMVTANSGTSWNAPHRAPLSLTIPGGEAHIYDNGKKLLLNRYKELKEGEKGGIWVVHRKKENWGDPKFIISMGMRATATDKKFIYTTDISGYEQETKDGGIIAKFVPSESEYIRKKNPGGGVNSDSLDAHPFIAPDESYIIFNSHRHGGKGKSDLYICYKNRDGSWGEAVNLEALNTAESDWCATVSPDGKYLFFTRNITGNGDIYWVDARIIRELKPNYLR